jgi:hypothetical protein
VCHVTYVSEGAGGTTKSSRYMDEEFACGIMFFLCTFVIFTVCCPSSRNSVNRLRCVSGSALLGGGVPPTIPSATGLLPLRGCSTQQGIPAWRSSCRNIRVTWSSSHHTEGHFGAGTFPRTWNAKKQTIQ